MQQRKFNPTLPTVTAEGNKNDSGDGYENEAEEKSIQYGENTSEYLFQEAEVKINCGQIEEVIIQAENELSLSRSMLEPEFLDIIIERFVKEDANLSATSREPPPFCHKQLTYIALMKIHKRATLEQIIILLKFIFPSLTGWV